MQTILSKYIHPLYHNADRFRVNWTATYRESQLAQPSNPVPELSEERCKQEPLLGGRHKEGDAVSRAVSQLHLLHADAVPQQHHPFAVLPSERVGVSWAAGPSGQPRALLVLIHLQPGHRAPALTIQHAPHFLPSLRGTQRDDTVRVWVKNLKKHCERLSLRCTLVAKSFETNVKLFQYILMTLIHLFKNLQPR